ncbi:MAG: hypothetical protein Q9215_003484 [Flavoplaca cf. flavocitrina]
MAQEICLIKETCQKAKPIFSHDSDDLRRQQRTLPSLRDWEKEGNFMPDPECLSFTNTAKFPLGRRPCLLAHDSAFGVRDELLSPDSRGDILDSNDDGTPSRKVSLRRSSGNARVSDDGAFASGNPSLIRRRQAENIDTTMTSDPCQRFREDVKALPHIVPVSTQRKFGRTPNSQDRCHKHGNSKSAAIAHMEKERERRLHIGDLMKQIASLIKFSGPKVEILKKAVDCIRFARAKQQDLKAELEDLRVRYQTLKTMTRASGALLKPRRAFLIHTGPPRLDSISWTSAVSKRPGSLQDRLDILVANGGVNLLKRTSKTHGDVRVVVTSSIGYRNATGLDYSALTQTRPGDGDSVWDMIPAFVRYGNSKLVNVYFSLELDRRLREDGYTNMYCNSCHPGFAGATGLGRGGFRPWGGAWAESMIRLLMKPLNSVEDSSKTQTYLAASAEITRQDVHGQYWAPVWTWTQRYLRCGAEQLTELAKNEEKQKQLWAFSERAMEASKR